MAELPPDLPPIAGGAEEQPFEIPQGRPRRTSLKVAAVATIILVLAGCAGLAYRFVLKDKFFPAEEPKEEMAQENTEQPKNQPAEKEEKQPEIPCESVDCFSEKFKDCETAVADFTVGEVIYHDEIIGMDQETGFCKVRVVLTKTSDPDLLGKEMVCGYNKDLPFSEAVRDSARCSGPLYDARK